MKSCKQHGGSIATLKELQNFLKKTLEKDLKLHLWNEIVFQFLVRPDEKERIRLYKVTEIVADQLVENLAILLDSPDENEREQRIEFSSLEQMMNVIQKTNPKTTLQRIRHGSFSSHSV